MDGRASDILFRAFWVESGLECTTGPVRSRSIIVEEQGKMRSRGDHVERVSVSGLNEILALDKFRKKENGIKQKETRKKARELTNAKQDLGPIEDEIEELEAKEDPTGVDKNRLSHLRHELKRITKLKEDYLKDHPEHRALVYASTRKRQQQAEGGPAGPDRKLFGKDGMPLRPERSIYYDPVMNPYGIPPPGMPYRERREYGHIYISTILKGSLAPTPDPLQAAEDDEGSDDPDSGLEDVLLPPGPPPGGADSDSDDQAPRLPPDFVPPLPL
ncbi:11375_t:CDS:2, partial [Acaulospora colombiana]